MNGKRISLKNKTFREEVKKSAKKQGTQKCQKIFTSNGKCDII